MTDPVWTYGTEVETDALLALRHLVRHAATPRTAPVGLPGGIVAKRRGRGLETLDVRVFSDGDDMRHIDRNTTARTGVPHVRTFHDERERVVMLIADFRPDMMWGTRRALRSVAAAEALAMIGWRTIESGGRVGLIVLGPREPTVIGPRGRERAMVSIVGALSRAHRSAREAPGAMTLADGVDLATTLTRRGAALVMATALDNRGEGFDAAIRNAARRHDISAVLIRDRFEIAPPPGQYAIMTEDGAARLTRITGPQPRSLPERMALLTGLGVDVTVLDASETPEQSATQLTRMALRHG